MKRIQYIACTLFAAVAATMMTSCNDDYLAQDPLSFYEPSSTYNSEAGLKAAMAVCDRHLRYMFTTGNANNCPIATDYLFSDIGIYGKTDANATDLQDDFARKIQPTSGLLGNGDGNHIMVLWEESFNGIKYANTAALLPWPMPMVTLTFCIKAKSLPLGRGTVRIFSDCSLIPQALLA